MSSRLQEIQERIERTRQAIESGQFSANITIRPEDCDWLIARVNQLKSAVEDAIDKISSEYCSHFPAPCGSQEERCYAKEQCAALEDFE